MSSTPTAPAFAGSGFTPEQKEYLQGFMAGVAASGQFPFVGTTTDGRLTADPAAAPGGNFAAPAEETVFGTPLSDLCKEELWKHQENPLDCWERLVAHAEADRVPDAEHTYRFKTHGLFWVSPAQDSFMLRLRVPACEITAHQMHGLAELAHDLGAGCAHVTTRGNLQIREFKPRDIVRVLVRLQELGLTSRGAGADNLRNITASPNSGFDPAELIDVRPFAKALHHYILNHRDLYGLPRKFNVAFDNGGSVSVAADTNDIGFVACRLRDAAPDEVSNFKSETPHPPAPGVYFRVLLGGITGHLDFARDTGLLVRPSEAVAVSVAMIRVFLEHGDRTNRKKARLKYLLEQWGVERFLDETQKKLAFPLRRVPADACVPRAPVVKHGWLGLQRQSQRGFTSLGIGVPVGRMTSRQMHALADLATNYGRGELRLTVWQSVILPHVPDAFALTAKRAVERLGFFVDPHDASGGIVACTGNKGCKYAAADTKGHALALIKTLRDRALDLGAPVNIHFTGCPHSCAQHYCGDIGLLGAKLQDGTEGYHVVLGGGMDHEQGIAREIFRGVRAAEVADLVSRILICWRTHRSAGESFVAWARRHSVGELQERLAS
ncbi:NirA family protein [Opitutales bacterium ASA1]|uniref:NirA family protein n=1 Tax=Congregicoccus parvus TaxID=3081749 RepID=UPI002B2C1198|nr:NirA family protein [Opitutales bacterium ASA1]